jgi:2-amino-4-hydroxy-6-hydroxymethyldihydropteridine diphosphokinase
MNIVFLATGTNLGKRQLNLRRAVEAIGKFIGEITGSSSVYETEPWGFMSGEKFLNQVIKVETELSPINLLEKIHEIESGLGRVRGKEQYSSRIIDIDILLYEDMIVDEASLKIPHPLIGDRRFVLVPLCEIASELRHPVLNKTMGELLEMCKDKGVVRKLS